MKKKKALVIGITGQIGSYLAELLLSKNYEVHGLVRRLSKYGFGNVDHIQDKIHFHYGDLANEQHLCSIIYKLQPDEIYNLAAQSHVRISFDDPEYTGDITGLGVLRVLEAIRYFSPKSKFLQLSSSEMFGNSPPPQNEETPMIPNSPYAAAKLYGFHITNIYREAYNLFACNAIMFNSESPRRGKNFITRKITSGFADILAGKNDCIKLGNLDAKRDWSFVGDTVEADWLMLQQDKPDNFVIGTGETHTIRDFLDEVGRILNLDWTKYIVIDPNLFRPIEVNCLLADYSKAKRILKWSPKTSFRQLVEMMVKADCKKYLI